MATRKQLSKKIRFDVFKRDSFSCQYCGSTPPGIVLEVDHITPVSFGGDNAMDNLITSCFPCNRGKGANSLESVPISLKEKAKLVKEAEAQIAEYSSIMRAKRDRLEQDCWEVVEALSPGSSEHGFDHRSLTSIKMFLGKIPAPELIEAAEIASTKYRSEYKNFLYFCGICWRMIRERSDV